MYRCYKITGNSYILLKTSKTDNQRMGEETLTSVFTRLRGKFLRAASRFFPDEDDAADALQDAFCRLWGRRGEILSDKQAEAMAMTTVRNLGIDAYRHRKAAVFLPVDDERDVPTTVSADNGLEVAEQFEMVEAIIEKRLSDTQKKIFRMKEFDGESYEDIAGKLGMEQAAVRMQLSRARKTIRKCYQEIEENEKY